jgi:hypothetical protein
MTDPKLIELVARAYDEAYVQHMRSCGTAILPTDRDAAHRAGLIAVLAAITASGTHWVAPVEATRRMKVVGGVMAEKGVGLGDLWAAMRAAYLADLEEKT